jgi:ATP-dependent DNA helicase RecG
VTRLEDSVEAVRGVGPSSARQLAEAFGIATVRDLVEHYPRRYEDLGSTLPLRSARIGVPVTIVGTVLGWSQRPTRRRKGGARLHISEAEVRDREGEVFLVTFFNQRWRDRQLPPGTVAAFSGTLERRYSDLKLTSPRVLELAEGERRRLVPVYPASERLPSHRIAAWVEAALDALPPLEDPLPMELRARHRLADLDRAMRAVHHPEDHDEAATARRRLVFDELFTLQVGLQWRRARLEADAVGVDNSPAGGGATDRLLASLPFAPTGAQERAFAEIGRDLGRDRPMHRLLQGDVGSGKTLVAVWAMLCAVDRGRQAALMAPTEVLAEQHLRTLTELLAPLGVNVLDGVRIELLTSGTPTATKRRVLGELLSGDVDLVIGTHALLEEGVRFADLGVVVVDEQHRFGVHQRVGLKRKGRETAPSGIRSDPDVLVMTATPIPRSLALTLFGDLDVTVLDEMPPGREPVNTQLITPAEAERRERLYDFVRAQAHAGYQTYIVCPFVEESDELPGRAVHVEYPRLRDEVFPDLEVAMVHGRMTSDDKEAAMAAFRRGETDVLVATTVIEVGVDVPNATLMVIEDAERFGISQLHQLRGRVGRGGTRSYCVLFAGWSQEELTEEALVRLNAVANETDGFLLAEVDLDIRGEGQLFGVRQSGMPDLKIARLGRDGGLVELTREEARDLVESDPELSDPAYGPLRREVRRRYRGGLEELEALATG